MARSKANIKSQARLARKQRSPGCIINISRKNDNVTSAWEEGEKVPIDRFFPPLAIQLLYVCWVCFKSLLPDLPMGLAKLPLHSWCLCSRPLTVLASWLSMIGLWCAKTHQISYFGLHKWWEISRQQATKKRINSNICRSYAAPVMTDIKRAGEKAQGKALNFP